MRTILNRDFTHPADGWYHIEPKGEHPNKASGLVQVIDDAAVQSIVNRFNKDAAHPNFPGMLIDHEHFKHDQDKETRAYGWLMQLENREDGIYGRINWTGTGRAAVDAGDYRFFSTEYDPSDLLVLNRNNPARVRPVRLDGLTLTNQPNNRGGNPITNRGSGNQNVRLSPSQAGAAFQVIVNRIKTANGCSFEEAWNEARRQEPAAFAAMSGDQVFSRQSVPQNPVQNRAIVHASNLVMELAQARARANGGTFERAWHEVQREFPDLQASMFGRVFNRAGSAPESVSDGDWKNANARASDVMTALKESLNTSVDRGETVGNEHALRGAFKRYLRRLQDEDGMTFEQAFEHIKATEPVFWSRFVLNYELPE